MIDLICSKKIWVLIFTVVTMVSQDVQAGPRSKMISKLMALGAGVPMACYDANQFIAHAAPQDREFLTSTRDSVGRSKFEYGDVPRTSNEAITG